MLGGTRVVRWVQPGEERELARFMLQPDGTVVAEYSDEGWRAELERDGVYTSATGRVTPIDGRRFFDALAPTFSRSSYVRVERVDPVDALAPTFSRSSYVRVERVDPADPGICPSV
jgi:hypothetical protein